MKKVIIGLVLVLVPVIVFAAPDTFTGHAATGIQGNTAAEKKADMQEKITAIKVKRTQVKVLAMAKEEIKTQTKAQLQQHLGEVKELKLEMKEKFEGFKDLTAEERIALKDEIDEVKGELKSMHVTWLDLRSAARDEILVIKDAIQEINTSTVVTEAETEGIEDVIGDLEAI